MKKLTSIAIALALVLCFATVAFAADGTESDPYTSFGATLTIPAGETVVYVLPASEGETVTIEEANGEITVLSPHGMSCGTDNPDGSLDVSLGQNCAGGYVLYFSSTATEDKTYTIAGVDIGSGTSDDPYTEVGNTLTIPVGQEVYFQLTPSNDIFTITDANGEVSVMSLYGMSCGTNNADGSLVVSQAQNHMSGCVLVFTSTATENKTYTVSHEQPAVEGSSTLPKEITLEGVNTCTTLKEDLGWRVAWSYYFTYTATESGYLTIDVTNTTGDADTFDVCMTNSSYDYAYYSSGQNTIGVGAGETVTIQVNASVFDQIANEEFAADVSFTASFRAAESGEKYNPIVIEDKAKEYSFEVPLNGTDLVWVSLSDVQGAILTIKDADAVVNASGYSWDNVLADAETGILVFSNEYEENLLIGIATNGDDTKYTVTVSEPEGYDENPEKLDKIDKIEAEITYETNYIYHYQWIAPADGLLTLNVVEAEWHDNVYEGFITIYDEEGNPTGTYPVSYEMTVSVNGAEGITSKDSVTVDVKAGDVILVALEMTSFKDVDGYEAGPYEGYLTVTGTLDVLGSKNNPIVINNASELAGIDVAGKGETYIAVNSMLNGQILTIIGDDNTTVTYGTTEVKADNGVFAIELSGVPTNMIVVGNKGEKDASYIAAINYPMGSVNNPIVINNASELGGVDVAGKGETYIAVSSQLNGQILTIVGNSNTTVNVNGTAVTAVDGVFTVELTGVPTNKIVVGNKGEKDASYVASISYPAGSESNPTVVNPAAGAVKAEAAAGSTTYYVINGSYNGNYVVITGEGLTVTVNGTAVKASNGKYVVELTGTPVNSIVIANSGTAAVAYSIVTSDNPPTGDAGILMPAVAALVSVMGAAMLVMKKKEN